MGILNSKPKASGDDGAKSSARCRYSMLPNGKAQEPQPKTTSQKPGEPTAKKNPTLHEPFNPQMFR